MAKVSILMGSDSDLPVMSKAAAMLEKFGIDYEMKVISAHREPDVFVEYAKSAESKGIEVIIAGAGGAAHLPGMCAAMFPLPVIGVPIHTKSLGGVDSLYSNAHHFFRRQGFSLFDCTDAFRNTCCDSGYKRSSKCSYSCSKDAFYL